MGGYFSGRRDGRPIVEMSFRIDIGWMIRTGRATPGRVSSGILSWYYLGERCGWVKFQADMTDADSGALALEFGRVRGGVREEVRQTISLVVTRPNFGGRRWWMVCPARGARVAKLYRPQGGDLFAGRVAWRLGYQCQRADPRDRPFEAMFRLQKKLGGEIGWDRGLARKPRGMWSRTYQRHWEDYERLALACDAAAHDRFSPHLCR